MAARPAHTDAGLLTMEFILSIGGSDTQETHDMVNVLNLLMGMWGREAMAHMESFLNLIKSRTDELAVTLQVGPPSAGTSASESGSGGPELVRKVACEKSVAALKAEKKELQRRLQEEELKVEHLQKEKSGMQTRFDELRKSMRSKHHEDFTSLIATYNKRCVELDSIKDEAGRHTVWFNEQITLKTSLATNQKQMEEIHSKIATESLQV